MLRMVHSSIVSYSAPMSPTPMAISKEVSHSMHFKSSINIDVADLTTKALSDSELTELKVQHALASAWTFLFPSFPRENIHVLPSIEHAIQIAEKTQSDSGIPAQVLVAGSLHLVGGVVEVAGLSEVAL